jgi:hypothetical protein
MREQGVAHGTPPIPSSRRLSTAHVAPQQKNRSILSENYDH